VQIDIGYGDAATPDHELVAYPTIIGDHPSPQLMAYPKETVIAEKLEARVSLGIANSRMKDYFDLYLLLGEQARTKGNIALAIRRTFECRKTSLPHALPIGLAEEFAQSPTKIAQWKAFLSRNDLDAPPLEMGVISIREALMPIMESIEGAHPWEENSGIERNSTT
jgi:Nucleotidyl transferase AbiEii toxin, Type IV TA system